MSFFEQYGFVALAGFVLVLFGVGIGYAERFTRRMQTAVYCRCGHNRAAHRHGDCIECNCLYWTPRPQNIVSIPTPTVTAKLVTTEDLVEQATKKGY